MRLAPNPCAKIAQGPALGIRCVVSSTLPRHAVQDTAQEASRMFDILYLAIGIAAFLVLTLYIYACDRL
jgi:hypothetical protein